jgi:DNA-binding SARP family transcriptional activator
MMESHPAIWRFELFGEFQIRRGTDALAEFPSRMTKALLAYLALNSERWHTRDELVDLIWPDACVDAGRHRLSQALSWLRLQLNQRGDHGAIICTNRTTIGLNPEFVSTDVADFTSALCAADSAKNKCDKVRALSLAVTCYHGNLLTHNYQDWVLLERRNLESAYLDALRRLAAHYKQEDQWDKALDCIRRTIRVDPLDEDAHCDLIRLLVQSGQNAAAWRQFRDLEYILAIQLGVKPSPATLALVEPVYPGNRVSVMLDTPACRANTTAAFY